MKSDALREIIKAADFVHLSRWEALVGDMVQDGLLTRDGQSYSFSHLSFQEYLCAKDIADPNTDEQLRKKLLSEYLSGDDWWREVVLFYAGMSNKPDQMLSMIQRLAQELVERPEKPVNMQLVKTQVQLLAVAVHEMFPKVAPQQ
jgi:predicted NACHT family NTPase